MNKTIVAAVLVVLYVFAAGCAQKHKGEKKTTLLSHFLSITDNEDKGVKEVLDYYGGYCEYSKGTANGKHFFELKLSKSKQIEKLAQKAELPASNMAYLFFRNLTEEKKNYDEVRAVLIFADGTQMNFSYPMDKLAMVNAKYSVLRETVDVVEKEDFNGLKNLFDSKFPPAEMDKMTATIRKYQPVLGEVKEIVPYGFKFYQARDSSYCLHLAAFIERMKQNNEFSIDLPVEEGNNKLLRLNYKF